MSDAPDQPLLEALLDSWDRNNAILVNLLRAIPEGGLEAKAIQSSPSVAELFTHALDPPRHARSGLVRPLSREALHARNVTLPRAAQLQSNCVDAIPCRSSTKYRMRVA